MSRKVFENRVLKKIFAPKSIEIIKMLEKHEK
jgi:hypothetical protein